MDQTLLWKMKRLQDQLLGRLHQAGIEIMARDAAIEDQISIACAWAWDEGAGNKHLTREEIDGFYASVTS